MLIDIFLQSLTPMLVLFLYLSIGFIAKRLHLLPDNAHTVMSKLETWIFCPALTISTFATRFTVKNLSENYLVLLYAIFGVAIAFVIGNCLARIFVRKAVYERNVYKYAMTIANYGFMGDPIVLGLFGADVLFLFKLFTLPLAVLIYTWGFSNLIPSGEKKTPLYKKFMNPMFFSLFVGAIIGITGLGGMLPTFINSTLSNLSGCMGPVAMILTGFTIGGYEMKMMLSKKKVYVASFLRLIVLPSIIIGILMLAGANDITLICAFFAFATPLGMNTVVFPLAYGADPSTGASMAMISHTLCIVTIPIMFALFGLLVDVTPFFIT